MMKLITAIMVAGMMACGSLSGTIETATEVARAACRAIARDWTPDILALMERLAAAAEAPACVVPIAPSERAPE